MIVDPEMLEHQTLSISTLLNCNQLSLTKIVSVCGSFFVGNMLDGWFISIGDIQDDQKINCISKRTSKFITFKQYTSCLGFLLSSHLTQSLLFLLSE
ncbi:unnamed protein product [Lupinus luteus]|uniref:Uncharacterized protein n=1 Tax=Lupinus luteus TaxID=3873 RepID=A0AAV1XY33_LUPLU